MGIKVRLYARAKLGCMPRPYFLSVLLPVLVALAGCSTPPLRPEVPPEVEACLTFLNLSDKTVQQAGVGDAQSTRVPGFPYLRVNRFLASFTDEDLPPASFQAWMGRMQALDFEARDKEYRALSAVERARLGHPSQTPRNLSQRARICAERLYRSDVAEAPVRLRLLQTARVPSEYVLWQQILGLYPLTSLGVLQGVLHYQREAAETYATPLKDLPVRGRLVRFTPPIDNTPLRSREVATILRRSADNPLQIPNPDAQDQRLLFATFAPAWEVDVAGKADRIGMPYWDQTPEVNTGNPVVFTHLSHGRLGGEILLQLNYVIWFPARPRTGALDLLGGRLDGITWRVTLAADGQPLLYESVHNCGCYHRFFPTDRLRLVHRQVGFEEPILVAQRIPLDRSRKVLRIASSSHFVQRVYAASGNAPTVNPEVKYRFHNYDLLRALPAGEGYRSLFGPDGIVPHTERRERCLLWPTGVRSPGAMRQWGRHAVAFVGERHFDAPDLIERYFQVVAEEFGEKRASDD
jgi:hypothetical protein